jgi:PTH1 family peptidyl-tRNA hydrolase
MSIELVVGLGNPGSRYDNTRHNAGFWLVDKLAEQAREQFRQETKFHGEVCRVILGSHQCWLLKPAIFMNKSGQAIGALANFYKITPEQILVVHDELDLPCGTARLKKGGGAGGHNGLKDTIAHLGTQQFIRARIGIDHPGNRAEVVNYVLKPPSQDEKISIDNAIERLVDVMPLVLSGGTSYEKAMQQLHTK